MAISLTENIYKGNDSRFKLKLFISNALFPMQTIYTVRVKNCQIKFDKRFE